TGGAPPGECGHGDEPEVLGLGTGRGRYLDPDRNHQGRRSTQGRAGDLHQAPAQAEGQAEVTRYPPGTVIAAGALVWRIRDDELQVLAVHRPRYDDWSWPKGKIFKNETLPACAI